MSEEEKKEPPKMNLDCSFCGKSQEEVKALIAGPNVFICSECVHLCGEILYKEHGVEPYSFSSPFIRNKEGREEHMVIDVVTGARMWVRVKEREDESTILKGEDNAAEAGGPGDNGVEAGIDSPADEHGNENHP